MGAQRGFSMRLQDNGVFLTRPALPCLPAFALSALFRRVCPLSPCLPSSALSPLFRVCRRTCTGCTTTGARCSSARCCRSRRADAAKTARTARSRPSTTPASRSVGAHGAHTNWARQGGRRDLQDVANRRFEACTCTGDQAHDPRRDCGSRCQGQERRGRGEGIQGGRARRAHGPRPGRAHTCGAGQGGRIDALLHGRCVARRAAPQVQL